MEIICFSFGKSESPKTWSNVPYFFVNELEKQGKVVHCVNIYKSRAAEFFCKAGNKILRWIFGKNTQILIENLPILDNYYNRVVLQAVNRYPNASKLLFFSYNLNGSIVPDIDSILFFDFSIEYAILNIQKRASSKFENKIILHQNSVMQEADKIVSLFPAAADIYEKKFGKDKIIRIPGHILNCDWQIYEAERIVKQKANSNQIVFIGRKPYLSAAKILVDAIHDYNSNNDPIHLTVIGLTSKQLGLVDDEYIKAYGILDKSNSEERNIFYRTIEKSRLIVNTKHNWVGISSIVEAMFLYTPFVVAENEEFKRIFGTNPSSGYYCKPEDSKELVRSIEKVFSMDVKEYEKMCYSAHKDTEGFSWEKVIRLIFDFQE